MSGARLLIRVQGLTFRNHALVVHDVWFHAFVHLALKFLRGLRQRLRLDCLRRLLWALLRCLSGVIAWWLPGLFDRPARRLGCWRRTGRA